MGDVYGSIGTDEIAFDRLDEGAEGIIFNAVTGNNLPRSW